METSDGYGAARARFACGLRRGAIVHNAFSYHLVSGAALPATLCQELGARGVDFLQCYAIAEVGVIAYETAARDGMVVNEHVIVEIVYPGTGDPVPDGNVGCRAEETRPRGEQ